MFEYKEKQYSLKALQQSAATQGYDNFEEFMQMYKDDGMVEVSSTTVTRKGIIPNADKLEGMTDGSVFFVERNLTQNLNKHFNKIGEDRYTIVESDRMHDAIQIFDNKTLTYSPSIHLPGVISPSQLLKGYTWENVNNEIADWIESGNNNTRQKTAANIQDEKVVAEKMTDLNVLSEILGGEEFLYRAEEGETDIIDWANMENSKRVKDKLYKYFGNLKGGFVTDESTVQLMVDNFIKEQTINQSVLENKKDDTYFIQKLHESGMTKKKIYDNWEDNQVKLMNEDAKKLYLANNQLKKLIEDHRNSSGADYDAEKLPANIVAQQKAVEKFREIYGGWWNKSVFGHDKGEGQFTALIDFSTYKTYGTVDLSGVDEISAVQITEEEFKGLEKKEREDIIRRAKNGPEELTYLDYLERANHSNIEDTYRIEQEGKEKQKVVINNSFAESWLAKKGIKSIDTTDNGLVYNLSVDFLAKHKGRLIHDDGNWDWTSADDDARTRMGKDFKSPRGYFGLLENDADQDFTYWEEEFFDTDDPRNSLNNYKSSSFVNMIDGYHQEKAYALKKNAVFSKMLLLNIDPGSELGTVQSKVKDIYVRADELLTEGIETALVGIGIGEEDVDVDWSIRNEFDVLDQISTEYGIDLTEEAKDKIKRNDAYKAFEGVTNFVPVIAEFALIEVALKKTGAITGIPRLISNLTKGVRTASNAGVNANRMKVLQNIFRTRNGIPASQAVNISDDAFAAFLTQRGYKVGLGYNSWGNVLNHGYHAVREEIKMKIAFDEHYHLGGGVAFYGVGAMLNKMVGATKINQLNSVINIGKSGTAGLVSVQAANALESLVDDIAGNQTFMNAMREHYDFNEPWEEQAFIDFLVFSIIGVKGGKGLNRKTTAGLYRLEQKYYGELYGDAGLYNNLPTKPIYSGERIGKNKKGEIVGHEYDWVKANKNPEKYTGSVNAAKKIKELEQKYNSTKDVHTALRHRLDIINKHNSWENEVHAEREVNRTSKNLFEAVYNATGVKYSLEITNDKKEAGDYGLMKDKDAAAGLNKTTKKLIINTDHVTPGKVPHEAYHIVFKEIFKDNPIIGKQFKAMIKSSFKGKIYRGIEVIENGERTGEIKDMTLEEMIQNEYSGKGKKGKLNFDKIEAEEYVAYVAELLVEGKYYGEHVGGNVFKDLMQGINRFSNQKVGKNIFGKDLTSKQNVITFLGNFAKSVKSGKVTEKQIMMFDQIKKDNGWIEKVVDSEGNSMDTRTEGDKALSTEGVSSKKLAESTRKSNETQDAYNKFYKSAKTEEEKDKIAEKLFIGGSQIKKVVNGEINELYRQEIKFQNPKLSRKEIQYNNPKKEEENSKAYKDKIDEIVEKQNKEYDAKIEGLIEKGKDRILTEGRFGAIVNEAINELGYGTSLSYTEKQTFFRDIMRDPFKSEKAKARGVSGLIKDYRPEEGQNLTQMVREHLLGGRGRGSRLHEIKDRPAGKIFEGQRVATEDLKEGELGITEQKSIDKSEQRVKRGTIDIAENIKVDQEVDVPNINRKAGDVISKSQLKEMTTRKVGENMLDVTRPIVEGMFGRTPEFYAEVKRAEKGKSAEYKKVITDTREVLRKNAKTFHAAIQKQISEMTGEVSGSMNKFGELFEPTGRRVQFKEMPTWLDLTSSQKARGPFVHVKKGFDVSEARGQKAFLDFMYTNPETGKPLTNAQVNTRVENLIDQVAISMGAQRAEKLLDQPAYRDMILAKEGIGKMMGREQANLEFLNKEIQINKVRKQVRDTLGDALSSKKDLSSLVRKHGVEIEKRFIGLASEGELKAEEIIDILSIDYPFLKDVKELQKIDLSELEAMALMQKYSKADRTFGKNWAGEMKVGPGGVELFPGGVTSNKKYSLNEAIVREAELKGLNSELLDLRSANMKFKGKKGKRIAKDYYFDFLPRVAKKLGLEVLELNMFQKMMGEGTLEPNIFGRWQYRLEKYQTKDGEIILKKNGEPKKGKWHKANSEKDIPKEAVQKKLALLNAKTTKGLIEKYKKDTKKRGIDLSHARIKDNSVFLREWNDFVTKVEAEGLEGKELEKTIKEWSNKKLSAKGDYAATKRANKDLLEHISVALNEVYNDLVKEGKEEFAINNLHLLYQSQTSIGLGPFRGLATHKSGTLEKAEGMKFDEKGELIGDWKDYYRSEHFFQNVNLVGNNLIGTMKYHDNNTEFKKIHKTVSDMFGQAGITKRHQVVVDKDGNTVNIIEKEGLGTRSLGEFNLFNDRIALEKTIDFESGKMFSEIMYPEIYKVEVLDNLRKIIDAHPIARSSKKLTKHELIKRAITIDKAIALGRKNKKEKRGMSTWDFDDTLARTKSGVRYTLPNPSGKPAPQKKVIFMAGGAGSGKSNVIKKLGFQKQGFKIVNQDISLEWLAKNSGLPTDMRDFTTEQASEWGSLQWQARDIAQRKQTKFQGKGDGIIVDGTGASSVSMSAQVMKFRNAGYDVQMVFVETSLDVALARNEARKERSLKDFIVERNHKSVMANKKGFKELFGERFAEVNTDNLKMGDAMPPELIVKLDAFTKGYIKGRLNAGEYAGKGTELKEQGAEFDFSEFNVVKDGEQGPFFQKALDRAKKFGLKDQFVLTARPPEAAVPIYEFLKAQGLEIPLKNITGLGNSAGEAKAMWMLEKFSEGYNDMYFADDAMQNVKAVKDVLNQLDVKSRVQLAKSEGERALSKREIDIISKNIKDVEGLSSPDVYDNIRSSKKHRTEYENTISKYRPDLVKDGLVSQTIDNMFVFVDNLNIPNNKKRKYEQITTKWLATSNVKLIEDRYKITDAINLAEKYKEDVFSYRNPNELIEKYAGKVKKKFVNPNNVKEFSSSSGYKDRGITTYDVKNTREGQQAVRDVIDSHWGENSNPWCITQAKNGKLTEDAWHDWTAYEKGPKRIIFQDGKLSSFQANGQFWDRMDNATDGPTIIIKDGRVTKKVELVDVDGKIEESVRETRTVSENKKTVTTEIFADSQDGYTEGTKIVENRVNGKTVKSTRYNPDGRVVEIKDFDKDGKATASYNFFPDGKMSAVNNWGQPFGDMSTNDVVMKKGDVLNHQHTEGNTAYMYGKVKIDGEVTEIGWEVMEKNSDLKNVIKTVDGKVRIDLKKVLEIDPDAKGIPSEKGYTPVTYMSSKKLNLNKQFNKILEEVKDIGREKIFSEAKGRLVGAKKGKYKIFGTPGMEDFSGLVTYAFAGKGKQGEAHKKFFDQNLQKPFNRAYSEIHSRKQSISTDYKALRKAMPEVRKTLNDKVDGVYNVDQAIRVYNFNKAGFEVPGLSKTDLKKLVEHVQSNPKLVTFADLLSQITMLPEGYLKPADYWLGENITMDMNNVVDRVYRKEALSEFVENREAIFGKWQGGRIIGENMNKIESAYGPKHREALENMLWRMENMTNRTVGADSNTNKWMNWVNSASGTIMFFNQKSAALQTISSLNYVNGTFNNPMRAAQAFANQPQYWKDFVRIFNSDMMLQRRSGLKINVEAAELMERVGGGENGFAKFRAFILEKGFIPTKYADSFAIASGGATFYRNSIRKYKKQGLSEKEAETKAWEDFAEMTEATQQSSRPDLISMQQASSLGRPILSFANTPMQMFRRHKRRIQDIASNRGNKAENVASALYYGFAQTMIFSYLANTMFAVDDESDDPKDIAYAEKQKTRHVNTIADSYLRGMGTGGAGVAALKNGILRFIQENKKDYNADYANVVIDMLNVSPPIGSKARKLYGAGKTWKYNKDVIPEMGFSLDNPATLAIANVISATTNMPTDRVVMKLQNIKDASNSDFETWQRISMLFGVNKWALGTTDEELEAEMEAIEKRVRKDKKKGKKKSSKKRKVYPSTTY